MTFGSALIPLAPLAFSLSALLAITFLLCAALGVLVPELGPHALLQFFPRFSWTEAGIHHGIVWSLVYGFYSATAFGLLFNFFGRRQPDGRPEHRVTNV